MVMDNNKQYQDLAFKELLKLRNQISNIKSMQMLMYDEVLEKLDRAIKETKCSCCDNMATTILLSQPYCNHCADIVLG